MDTTVKVSHMKLSKPPTQRQCGPHLFSIPKCTFNESSKIQRWHLYQFSYCASGTRYNQKYRQSFNLVVWLQTGHTKLHNRHVFANFKLGSGPSNGRGTIMHVKILADVTWRF